MKVAVVRIDTSRLILFLRARRGAGAGENIGSLSFHYDGADWLDGWDTGHGRAETSPLN